jgi:hypothetical protein
MTRLQRIILRLLPGKTAGAARAESERWQVRCRTCGLSRSVWEIGGVRYGARSRGKRTLVRCPQCRRLRVAAVERR